MIKVSSLLTKKDVAFIKILCLMFKAKYIKINGVKYEAPKG